MESVTDDKEQALDASEKMLADRVLFVSANCRSAFVRFAWAPLKGESVVATVGFRTVTNLGATLGRP